MLIFKQIDKTMMKLKRILILMVAIVFSISSWAQETTVSGVVTSAKDGSPIVNVDIRLQGAIEISSKTNKDGKFEISIPTNSSNLLIFTHPSFDAAEVNVAGKTVADVKMVSAVRRNAYGKIVERKELNTEAQNGVLVFESPDQQFKYWFDTRIYFDGMIPLGETLNDIGNGVDIRRARFALKAKLWENWYGEFDIDVAGAVIEMKDMIVQYNGTNWNVKGGHFKEGFSMALDNLEELLSGFSMETTTTSRYVTFIERSLASKMAPSRHLGIQGNYWGQHFLAIAGVHFRAAGELEENEFAQDANKDNGISDGYSYTGRFVYMPIQEEGKVVHIGIAGSYRTPKTSLESADTYRYSTRSLTSINRKKYLDTDDISDVKSTTLLGAELAGAWNQFMLQGEYMITKINRENGATDAQIKGGYAQAGMLLFGGRYVYNNMEGEFTQVERGQEWGDIEIAARFDYMNANDFDAEIYGGAANAYTLGINYHVNDNVKFMLNYSYIDHDRYANGKDKLYVGKDVDGNLTKDPFAVVAPEGEGGDDFSILSARIEIDF